MKARTIFVDRNGSDVKVGDRVKAVGVNEWLTGIVVSVDADKKNKPFQVKADRDGKTYFMNREWTEKVAG